MTVRLDDGVIRLEGACAIDEAEHLLALRAANPEAPIDWRRCDHAHAAVIQLLLIGRPTMLGPPAGAFLDQMIQPLLNQNR